MAGRLMTERHLGGRSLLMKTYTSPQPSPKDSARFANLTTNATCPSHDARDMCSCLDAVKTGAASDCAAVCRVVQEVTGPYE